MSTDFALRYYAGHKGRFGHEFLEFEFRADGLLRYANNSNYRRDSIIRKEVYLSADVLDEVKRIVTESAITQQDDRLWPEPNEDDGRQELELSIDDTHVSFVTAKINSLVDLDRCADSDGIKAFYFLVQDLRSFVFSLISLHFKIKPI